MNFIAHRSLVEADPSVNVGLASRDEFLGKRLNRAMDAVEKFDWKSLHTACVNGSFGNTQAINLQIRELSKFLVLKAVTDENESARLAPSKMIERIWRLLILFSKDYRYLCDNLLSDDIECRFIDHDPLDNMKEAKHVRYYNTISLYCKIFKEAPPLEVWPHPEASRPRANLVHINSSHHSGSPVTVGGVPVSKKRIRFSPEIEVKVYCKESESSSPPVAMNYFKPSSLQLTPTKPPASSSGGTHFAFDTPTPPSGPHPSPSAFLLACQRVIKAPKRDGCSSPRSSMAVHRVGGPDSDSPPTLPLSVFSSIDNIAPEKGSPPRQQITLRFMDVDNGNEKFDMNTKFGTPFKSILASYKKKRDVCAFSCVRYKGVEVDDSLTPNDLGMTHHDRLEVYGCVSALASPVVGSGGGGGELPRVVAVVV